MEKLTVYIPRYITDEQSYLMFIECLEQANKHIINFDVQFIVLCDNENIITKKYDPLMLLEYNNIIFVNNELKGIPDLAGYYYHYKYHPTEYMLQLFANVMLNKYIDYTSVINSVRKYGCYSLCYNYCNSNTFTQIYNWMKIIFPELNFYKDYLNKKSFEPDYVSAQANQMFTTYTNLCKVKEKFPYTFIKLMNYDKIKYDDYKSSGLFNERQFNRQIRTVTEHLLTQLFFKVFQTPTENIKILGSSETCMYGITFVNLWKFCYILTGQQRTYPTEKHFGLYLQNKNNNELKNVFCKFCTGEIVN